MKFPLTPETIERLKKLWYIFNALHEIDTAKFGSAPRHGSEAKSTKESIEELLREGNIEEARDRAEYFFNYISDYREPPHCCSCRCNDD